MGRRDQRRHKLKLRGKRGGKYRSGTPTGKVELAMFTEPLAAHLTKVLDDAPGHLSPLLRRIPTAELAQAVLSPLQHSIAIGWQDSSLDWRRETAERVGSNIHDLLEHKALLATGKLVVDMKRLRKRRKPGEPPRKLGRPYKSDLRDLSAAGWDKRDLCQVGYWLMYQARTMPYFTGRVNSRQSYYMLEIAPDWSAKVADVRRKFIEADKDQLPSQEPPPDWTGMQNGRVSFISGNHPECRDALAAAFERGGPAIVKHTEPDGTVITAKLKRAITSLTTTSPASTPCSECR
jgi:hypothetical protein